MRMMPAEWAPQSGVILTWPHQHGDWADNLAQTEKTFTELAAHISQQETALIICWNHEHISHVRQLLANHPAVNLLRVILTLAPSNDSWARDHAPITVIDNGRPVLLDFTFNGWGNKYPSTLDNEITRRLYAEGVFGDTPLYHSDMVLEGGSIDSNGQGVLLTTSRCLLSPARNPHMNRDEIDLVLREQLGVTTIHWLEHGALDGDDTDSHIDMLARFCNETTIAYTQCPDANDSQHDELNLMEKELQALQTANGNAYDLVPLPLPAPVYNHDGKRLPASYANFLIINEAVLVPVYGDPADELAISRLQQCFQQRTVIPVSCRSLIEQYGSLHCVSMQLAADVLPRE